MQRDKTLHWWDLKAGNCFNYVGLWRLTSAFRPHRFNTSGLKLSHRLLCGQESTHRISRDKTSRSLKIVFLKRLSPWSNEKADSKHLIVSNSLAITASWKTAAVALPRVRIVTQALFKTSKQFHLSRIEL